MNILVAKQWHSSLKTLLLLSFPLAVLGAAFAWLLNTDPLSAFRSGAPPVENITFERTILDADGIRILIRAGGAEPMTIAQLQVDDAYWQFRLDPPGPITRGGSAWISIPFPWILGERHTLRLVTNLGTTFGHEVSVAVPTPTTESLSFAANVVLGAFVGLLPVAVGLMFYPLLRDASQGGLNFLLAVTVGLLAFLLVDAFEEALGLAAQAAPIFQAQVMVVLVALVTFSLLMAAGRTRGVPGGLTLAIFMAIGIGLHNFGEGLAIGASFASGAASLGTFLVIGFTLHNITEGIGIASPILRVPPPRHMFLLLVVIAGGPAVVGLWVGSLAYAPHWSALALAVGAGAIMQVVVEVISFMIRTSNRGVSVLSQSSALGGFTAGIAVMFVTAMLIKV